MLRYADIGLLIAALPIFLVAGWPMLGYAVCAAAWLAQHGVLAVAERGVKGALAGGDRRRALGIMAAATLGRLWLVTLAILLVGLLAEREDGLAAAVLTLALVTVHLGSIACARLLYPEEGR
ncbi:MAG: hypothetical protein ACJ75R_05405 [Solirubrobacterales bacterium]